MADLPKIVWHRLRRTSVAPASAGPVSTASGSPKAIEHPDANLIAAFLEQSLTKRERELVMTHLAECADCREQVALALPEAQLQTAARESLGPMRHRPTWKFWQVVRWAALAASLGVIAVVVVLHHPQSSQVRMPATPATENKPAPENARQKVGPGETADNAGEAAPPSVKTERPSGESTISRQVEMASRKEQTAASGDASKFQVREMKDREGRVALPASRTPLREERDQASESTPPAPRSSARDLRSRLETGNLNAAADSTTTATPRATADAPSMEKLSPAIGGALQAHQIAKAREDESSHTKVAQAESAVAKNAAAAPSAKMMGALQAKAPTSAAGQPGAADTYSHENHLRSTAQFSAAGARTTKASGGVAGRWTISPSGKVQHSLDIGKTWQVVDIDDSITFRALAVMGTEVWVGGTGGALYHSADNGGHWGRISLTVEHVSLGDILGISFTDPAHGAVTTSTGRTWITVDAGRHWSRKQ